MIWGSHDDVINLLFIYITESESMKSKAKKREKNQGKTSETETYRLHEVKLLLRKINMS